MPPLCRELHSKLTQKFGKVRISSEGHSFQSRMRKIGREIRKEIINPGEYYCVNCPFCNDSRNRLWINHTFAEHPWMAVCYNETRCMDGPFGKENRIELYKIIFDGASRVVLPVIKGIEIEPTKPLEAVSFPGDITFLNDLPEQHVARQYLEIRGYDSLELALLYDIGVCTKVYNKIHYPLVNRLFIPVSMDGKLVGWQGRYVGDLDWKTTSIQKYFNLRGMSKKDMLYNFDTAKTKDMVVIVEGAADVWRVGPSAVALMGSDMSESQRGIVRQTWSGKPVAVFLDNDASDKAIAIANSLYPFFGSKVFPVLTDHKDPGSMSRDEIWRTINLQLESRGLLKTEPQTV